MKPGTSATEPVVVSDRLLTIPNALCVARLLGSPVMIPVALADQGGWLLMLYLFLAGTDWVDGKLAVWLNQRSTFGARLDSVADAAMYGCLLVAAVCLRPDAIAAEWPWLAAVLLTYVLSWLASLVKFRRMPSYHTRSAKISWLLVMIAAPFFFLGWSLWPLRVMAIGITIANIEAIALTLLLSEPKADVRSVLDVVRAEKKSIDA